MVTLRLVTPDDVEWIEAALDSWECSARWSFRGGTPSVALVDQLLWSDVPLQRAVWTEADGPIGLLQVFDVDLQDDVADLALVLHPDHVVENRTGLATFLGEVFDLLPLRKVCIGVYGDRIQLDSYVAAGCRFVGRHRDHQRRSESTFADLDLYEIWRDSR